MVAKSTAPGPDPDQDYCDAMRDAIATHWAAVWKAVPAVIASDEPEAVHKVRVASRRLRAAMDVAPACFPRKWYRPLHKTAKAITRALGEVRDRDVLLEALARERDGASDTARPGIDYLITGLKRERKQARKAMLRFLATLESERIPKETRRRFPRAKGGKKGKPADARRRKQGRRHEEAPPAPEHSITGGRSPVPALDPTASLATNARRVLAERVDKLFSFAPVIPDAEATELLHDARIATKRLRYTLELFPAIFGTEGERAIAELQALQEALGRLHDHDVRIARIEEELAGLASQPVADALRPGLEELLQDERTIRAKQHAAAVERWRQLEREQLSARLMALTLPPD